MLAKLLGVVALLLTPKPRRTESVRLGLNTCEDRVVPAAFIHTTNFESQPVARVALTPGAVDILAAQVKIKSTHQSAATNSLVIDDLPQGLFRYVKSVSVSALTDTGGSYPLDTSVPLTRKGGIVILNHFPWQSTGDHDGVILQVRLNAISSNFTPLDAQVSIVGGNVRYSGVKSFGAAPAAGNGGSALSLQPTYGGPARTTYFMRDVSDAERTVTAADRAKVVSDFYDVSTHPKAKINCIRLITNNASATPYLSSATLWLVGADGSRDSLMTVKPDGYGRFIFTIYRVGRALRNGGDGVHLQITVNASPDLVGSRVVPPLGVYYSTHGYAGLKSYTAFHGYTQQPPNGNVEEVGVSAEFQHVLAAGDNVELADLYIYRLDTERLVTIDLTFTGTAPVDLDLRRRDDNGNETGPALGSFSVIGDHLYITLDLSFNGTLVLDLDGDTFGAFRFTDVHAYIAA